MGWSTSRSGAAGRRVLVPAALLLASLALTACGSVVAGSGSGAPGSTPAQLTLCSDTGAVNHLVVTRKGIVTHALAQSRFTFPAVVTVTSAPEAQAVAKALCALPRQPAGITNCPADFGIVYQLRFATGGRHFGVVKVESTGCQIVSGAGKPRTISRAPGFWGVLGKAMRLPGPVAQRLFIGTGKGGKKCAPASTQMAQTGSCPGHNQPG
jgi:hypothetical protein